MNLIVLAVFFILQLNNNNKNKQTLSTTSPRSRGQKREEEGGKINFMNDLFPSFDRFRVMSPSTVQSINIMFEKFLKWLLKEMCLGKDIDLCDLRN